MSQLQTKLNRHRYWYQLFMSMNLRLSQSLAKSLKALSKETGKSQQELAREAISEYITNYKLLRFPPDLRHLIIPSGIEFGEFFIDESLRITLPPGESSDEILHELRRDRF